LAGSRAGHAEQIDAEIGDVNARSTRYGIVRNSALCRAFLGRRRGDGILGAKKMLNAAAVS